MQRETAEPLRVKIWKESLKSWKENLWNPFILALSMTRKLQTQENGIRWIKFWGDQYELTPSSQWGGLPLKLSANQRPSLTRAESMERREKRNNAYYNGHFVALAHALRLDQCDIHAHVASAIPSDHLFLPPSSFKTKDTPRLSLITKLKYIVVKAYDLLEICKLFFISPMEYFSVDLNSRHTQKNIQDLECI